MIRIPVEFPEQEPEPEEVNIIREHDARVVSWFELPFQLLDVYQRNQIPDADLHNPSVKCLRMSLRAMALALGYRIAAGADTPTELARQFGFSKQRVDNCVNDFRTALNLPGDRSVCAKRKMSAARKRQVK